jgi:hypothetical protein
MATSDESADRFDGRRRMHRAGTRLLSEDGRLTRLVRGHRLLFTLLFFGVLTAVSVTASFVLRFLVLDRFLATGMNQWHLWWLAMLAVTVPVRLLFLWARACIGSRGASPRSRTCRRW